MSFFANADNPHDAAVSYCEQCILDLDKEFPGIIEEAYEEANAKGELDGNEEMSTEQYISYNY